LQTNDIKEKKNERKVSLEQRLGLAVEHSAHDRKVVGSILSNARRKWCQSHAHARINSCTQSSIVIEKKYRQPNGAHQKNI